MPEREQKIGAPVLGPLSPALLHKPELEDHWICSARVEGFRVEDLRLARY